MHNSPEIDQDQTEAAAHDKVNRVANARTAQPGRALDRSNIIATPAPALPDTRSAPSGGIARGLIALFAVASGMAVANMYYAQPMLATIARHMHTSSGVAGQIVTVTQAGYALGLLFLVPLGDLLNRRRLIVGLLLALVPALLLAALAPTIGVLLVAALVIGLAAVAVMVLVPFAASLAGPAERGRVVGTIMSGLLIGILISRTVSGVVSQAFGWRIVFAAAAILMLLLAGVLWRVLPRRSPQAATLPYPRLLASIAALVRAEPVLRRRALYGALAFAMFSVLWTNLAFLLAHPPYGYDQALIGLFGLAGVGGAAAASLAGRWADRGWHRATTGGFILASLAAFGLLALGGTALIPLIAGIVLIDLGAQGIHVTNQSIIYRLRGTEQLSRITTAYMVTYFIGGAAGSAVSALVFAQHGWLGVCLVGALLALGALALWLSETLPVRQHQP